MAGNSVIGALRVVLGMDSAELEDGYKRAGKSSEAFGTSLAKHAAVAAAAVSAMAVAIGLGIKHAIDEADKLGKMAQKVGIPVEELSKLALAAKLSDVSMESLSTAMGKLSKNMVAVASGADNEVSRAFKAIGVSATDANGKIRPTADVLGDIAGKFKGYEDGASKTALAIQLFGKAGAGMIPLLNSGKDGLREAAEEAEKFGIVLDTKTAKAAEAFNDNLTRLGKVKDGIILKITAQMLPALEQLSVNMVKVAGNAGLIQSTAELMSGALTGVVSVTMHLITGWQRLGIEFAALQEFMQTDVFSGKVAENWAKFTAAGEETKRVFALLKMDLEGFVGPLQAAATAAATNGPLIAAPIVAASASAKGAVEAFLASQQKSIATQQAEILANDLGVGAKERLRVQLQANAIALANNITLTDAMRAKIDAVAISAEEMTQKLKGAQLIQENKLPHEKLRKELADNELAMRAMSATAEEIARAQEKATERLGMGWQNAAGLASSLAGSLSQLTGTFSKENKAMGIASKAFAIGQAIINTQMAITKALAFYGPTPWGLAAAGVAAAAGASSIATIAMQKFKTGTDFTVPGGIGGGDRVPFNAMLEPGEHVQITPNSAGSSGRGMGGDRTVTVRFEGDDFGIGSKIGRKILAALNEVIMDGGRLRTA